MKRNTQILFATILLALVLLYAGASRDRNRYQEYLAWENQKVLQRTVQNMTDSQEILQGHRDSGTISRRNLSLLGVKAQEIRSAFIRLQEESRHFLKDKDYDHEAYNILAGYFDGISLFISMDLFEGQGNAFPHLEDPTLFNMDEEEMVLEHMLHISDLLLSDLQASEITPPDGTEDYQSLSHRKELSSLMDTVRSMSEDLDAYLKEIQLQSDKTDLTLKFIEEVVYRY